MRIRFIILLLLAPALLRAQPSLLLGGGMDWRSGSQSAGIPFAPGADDCGTFTDGSTSSFSPHLSIVLPSLLASNIGASLTVGWENHRASFEAMPPYAILVLNDEERRLDTAESRQHLEIATGRVTVGLGVRTMFADAFWFEASGVAGVAVTQSAQQSEIRTGEYRFIGGSDTREVTDGIPFMRRDFSFGFAASLSYRLPLSNRFWIAPHLTARLDLLSPVNEASWTTMSFGGGASLLVDPSGSSARIVPPPPIASAEHPDEQSIRQLDTPHVSEQVPKQNTVAERTGLDAEIAIYSVDAEGRRLPTATVRVYEVIHRMRDASDTSEEGSEGIISEEVEREYAPPALKLVPRIEAAAGVRRWTIRLMYNDREVARYSSNPDDTLSNRRIDWRIDAEQTAGGRSLLSAALTVEDSAGATLTSHSQIPLFIERSSRIVERTVAAKGGRERISWSLMEFGGDAVTPGDRNERVLAEIASAVQSGASITVVGYGEEELLPRRRADHVAALLRRMVGDVGRKNVSITVDVEKPVDASGALAPVAVVLEQQALTPSPSPRGRGE